MKKFKKRKIEAKNSIWKNNNLRVYFLQLQIRFFVSPNSSFFHLLYAFGAQKSDFKHSSFIVEWLKKFGDLKVSIYFVTSQKSYLLFLFAPDSWF